MEFRPCIDIHNGKVKQIVGGSLRDAGNAAVENFVAEQDAAFFARLYQKRGIKGGAYGLLPAYGGGGLCGYLEIFLLPARSDRSLSSLVPDPGETVEGDRDLPFWRLCDIVPFSGEELSDLGMAAISL